LRRKRCQKKKTRIVNRKRDSRREGQKKNFGAKKGLGGHRWGNEDLPDRQGISENQEKGDGKGIWKLNGKDVRGLKKGDVREEDDERSRPTGGGKNDVLK